MVYSISIKKPNWKGYKYAVFYDKKCGNMSGGCTEFKTKEELITFCKKQMKSWQEYDSILGRIPDKLTEDNFHFESFTDDIKKAELLGNTTLSAFFS